MTKRNYSNVAPPLPLSVAVNNSAVTLTVTSTTGYPAAPFILALERGTATEEVCLCTAKTSTTFTVTRGYDGTTAAAHTIGAMVEHTVSAIEYREASNTPMTTAERDALTGVDLWDGRFISNTTTGTIDRYNLGTTSWVPMAKATETAPATHSHLIADLPVADDGESNVSEVVRSNDGRLSNPRTPTAHTHPQSDVTDLVTDLGLKAPKASPTFTGTATFADALFTGTATLGDADTDVVVKRALEVQTHQRNTTMTYNGDNTVATVVVKSGATTVRTVTLTYSAGKVTQTVEVAGGKTITTAFAYTGDNLTSTTRTVV